MAEGIPISFHGYGPPDIIHACDQAIGDQAEEINEDVALVEHTCILYPGNEGTYQERMVYELANGKRFVVIVRWDEPEPEGAKTFEVHDAEEPLEFRVKNGEVTGIGPDPEKN